MTRPRAEPRRPLPGTGTASRGAPLPFAVPLLAALGLAILALCMVPAVASQQRLEREHARLEDEVRDAETRVEALRHELRDGSARRYLGIKATRALLHRGMRYREERARRLRRGR